MSYAGLRVFSQESRRGGVSVPSHTWMVSKIGRRIVKCRCERDDAIECQPAIFSIMRLVATSYTIRIVPSRREHIGWPDFVACSQREIHFNQYRSS